MPEDDLLTEKLQATGLLQQDIRGLYGAVDRQVLLRRLKDHRDLVDAMIVRLEANR